MATNQYPAEGAHAPLIQPSAPPAYNNQAQPQQQQIPQQVVYQQQQQQIPPQQVVYQAPLQQQQQIPQQIVYQQAPQQQYVAAQPVATQGYKPPNAAGPNVVVVQPQQQQQPIIAPPISSRRPQQALCPRCQKLTSTRTTYVAGLGSWVVAGGICLFGCWAGCCLIPFCVDDMKDVEHRCAQCGTYVGVKKFM